MILFVDWWIALGTTQQIFWSLAIVASVLLSILFFVNLSGWKYEQESGPNNKEKRFPLTEPKAVLTAFTLFGWSGVIASYFSGNLQIVLVLALAAGLIGAMLPLIFDPLLNKQPFNAAEALKSTGKVTTTIPPHRNGFGKVYLNIRKAPYELDAVTAGGVLPKGVRVRVVEVLDERVLLVEAIEDHPEANPEAGAPTSSLNRRRSESRTELTDETKTS